MPADSNRSLPATADDFCSRGMNHLEAGHWKDAIDDFTQAIKLQPNIAAGYRFRAIAHAESGNVSRAIADLDQAIRLKPDDVQAYFDRGQFFFRQKQYDEALLDCNKGLQFDASHADLLALRGRVQEARGASEQAEVDLTRAIEATPKQIDHYFVWRADLRLRMGDVKNAIADFDQAVNLVPNNAYAISRRASAYWAERNMEMALADFSRAIELNKEWVWVRNGRGLVYHDQGAYNEALADFNASIAIDPNHGETYEFRAETWYKLARREEAMADLNEAIKFDPQSARLFNRRAMMHYFNREFAKSVRDHTSALKCEPNNGTTFNYLAWVWSTAPDPSVRNGRRALECATRACELTEWQTPGFLDTLAAAHAEVGNFAEAEKWADRAADLADTEPNRQEYLTRADKYRLRQPLRIIPSEEENRPA
jgi:tetratricopeptide (TPR) repeat protein